MFVVITRNFPPDIGGMQSLMEGLSIGLSSHGKVKVFADHYQNCEEYDAKSKLNIERMSGLKIIRKFRKANQIQDLFLKKKDITALLSDHWKSIEKISKNT